MMDADELRKTMKRLDAMSDRCDHLISRNRPLTLDEPPRRSRRSQTVPTSPLESFRVTSSPIASGQLTGNEMRTNGYRPRPQEHECCDPDGMWAAFEADFDEMVEGMR